MARFSLQFVGSLKAPRKLNNPLKCENNSELITQYRTCQKHVRYWYGIPNLGQAVASVPVGRWGQLVDCNFTRWRFAFLPNLQLSPWRTFPSVLRLMAATVLSTAPCLAPLIPPKAPGSRSGTAQSLLSWWSRLLLLEEFVLTWTSLWKT